MLVKSQAEVEALPALLDVRAPLHAERSRLLLRLVAMLSSAYLESQSAKIWQHPPNPAPANISQGSIINAIVVPGHSLQADQYGLTRLVKQHLQHTMLAILQASIKQTGASRNG